METITNLKYDMYDIYFAYNLSVSSDEIQFDSYATSCTQIEDALKLAKTYKEYWIKECVNRYNGGYYYIVCHSVVIAIF